MISKKKKLCKFLYVLLYKAIEVRSSDSLRKLKRKQQFCIIFHKQLYVTVQNYFALLLARKKRNNLSLDMLRVTRSDLI